MSEDKVMLAPIEYLTDAVEITINVIRQMVQTTPVLSGLAGYANQIEYLVKQTREAQALVSDAVPGAQASVGPPEPRP
jgi:hypothetical protein